MFRQRQGDDIFRGSREAFLRCPRRLLETMTCEQKVLLMKLGVLMQTNAHSLDRLDMVIAAIGCAGVMTLIGSLIVLFVS
jgi:hypothetical protein